ncbi:MAG: 16S rRNA (guanine(527)-N(7))-methyltransferase RsmG [Pseudomonadota bacterium]
MDRLKTYEALLKKWNPTINLVAKSTLEDAWTRHFLDSAQIYDLALRDVDHWADLGSGGGFPGMVIAIIAMEKTNPIRVTLVESDIRKCTFLRSVARETDTKVDIIAKRIEDCDPLAADVLSARALSDLSNLLEFADQHLTTTGEALFMKGASWRKEVENAQRTWRFRHQVATSRTKDGPAILRISGVSRA